MNKDTRLRDFLNTMNETEDQMTSQDILELIRKRSEKPTRKDKAYNKGWQDAYDKAYSQGKANGRKVGLISAYKQLSTMLSKLDQTDAHTLLKLLAAKDIPMPQFQEEDDHD